MKFGPVPYYAAAGLSVMQRFSRPLTEDDRDRLNRTGRWINEAAVVHLVATLLAHGLFQDGQSHRKEVAFHEHVGVARDLRNVILKEGGRYKREKWEHQALMAALVNLYGAEASEEDFPLDIDKVIVPMIEGCRRHAEACMGDGQ
jgi:hypothetical protein